VSEFAGVDARGVGAAPRRSGLAATRARYAATTDPDALFLRDLADRVEAARGKPRRTGPPRRALLLGYAGAGNTGADLRTIETILQLRRHAPHLQVELYALGSLFDHPVLAGIARLRPGLRYVPDVLDAALANYDLVINVEGSTYTSTFSDSLAGTLIGGLGLAAAHGALAVAYGVDSGRMSSSLTAFARAMARDVTVITRNECAREDLHALGIDAVCGADPGWAYRDETVAIAAVGRPPTVVICPSNPFWWPAVPDVARAAQLDAAREHSPLRYGAFHFHSWDGARAQAYERYVDEQARLVAGFAARGLVPVIVGMDLLDARACADVAERARVRYARDARVVARGEASMTDVLRALTHAECVVSTRFHATLVAISHGLPVFGIAVDERIERLLDAAGSAHWAARPDAPQLAARVLGVFDRFQADAPECAALRARHLAFAARQAAAFDAMRTCLPACGNDDGTAGSPIRR
jgi:polysaccharide pyruvyl transferase WcaK-like protein